MNMPDQEHWAIITTTSIYVPGDKRSRTHPGHGYPEHYEESIRYRSFTDYESLVRHVEYLTKTGANFKVIKARPLEVRTSITVSLT